MNTDSFVYKIEIEDFYCDIAKDVETNFIQADIQRTITAVVSGDSNMLYSKKQKLENAENQQISF